MGFLGLLAQLLGIFTFSMTLRNFLPPGFFTLELFYLSAKDIWKESADWDISRFRLLRSSRIFSFRFGVVRVRLIGCSSFSV